MRASPLASRTSGLYVGRAHEKQEEVNARCARLTAPPFRRCHVSYSAEDAVVYLR